MSKTLEYAIMVFLAGMLVIMFRWSENDKYDVMTSGNTLLNTRSGDVWNISSAGKRLVGDYKLTRNDLPDFLEIAKEIIKDFDKAKE